MAYTPMRLEIPSHHRFLQVHIKEYVIPGLQMEYLYFGFLYLEVSLTFVVLYLIQYLFLEMLIILSYDLFFQCVMLLPGFGDLKVLKLYENQNNITGEK